ncbi:MAG TPA: PBP1A family penicillin-binding protein [Candidatus Paceibacterota bacterium]
MSKRTKTIIWRLIQLALSMGLLVVGIGILWASNLKIPDFRAISNQELVQSTKIYDHTGEVLLYNTGENLRRTVIAGGDISRNIKNATVAIEDSEFYQHMGVKPTAILRAFLSNTLLLFGGSGPTQGGSTITQQVIKNSLLTQEKTLSRKLKEAILAIKLERVFTKDDILALYLNSSPYGGNIYGIEEASQTFFGKGATSASLAEAAYLAALPQAPTYYSPYGNNKESLEARKNLVLRRMVELSFITKEEADMAEKEKVAFLPQNNFTVKAPHFVFYIRQYLEDKYGKEVVERGGLNVITSLDWQMQQKAEEIVKDFAPLNETNYKAHNAGVVGVDPKTGKILIMVGSRDYFEDNNYANYNVTLAHRQPGSSFKPFVYATAFKKGYTPDTILFDLPTQFQTTCSPIASNPTNNTKSECYAPQNYDGNFRGPMTLRSALAQSINIPAIEVLYLAGIRDALATARDMGITTLLGPNHYGLTLVLGGGEVTPLELTNAYATFANDGIYNPSVAVIKVENSAGKILEEYLPSPKRVIDPEIARSINDILSDNEARAPSYGNNSPLYFPSQDVAVKTGTTNDYKDMWTVGYSPTLALGIWVGNNDNTSMEKKVAGFVVAPMWRKIFDAAQVNVPKENFVRPIYAYKNDLKTKPVLRGIWQGGETYTIDTISGKLATELTPPETRKELPIGQIHSILHWLDKDTPNGPTPTDPTRDPQYVYWETPVQLWAFTQGLNSSTTNIIPTTFDNVHIIENQLVVKITSPIEQSIYKSSDRMVIMFEISNSLYPPKSAELYLNGEFVGSTNTGTTGAITFIPNANHPISGNTEIKIVVKDTVYNRGESSIHLTLTE